jgi:hypothetical protein
MKMYVTGFVLFGLLAALAIAGGCIPSLNPLYKDQGDATFDPALLGEWRSLRGHEQWDFSRRTENSYTLIRTDREGFGVFEAHRLVVEGEVFLNLFPVQPQVEGNPFYRLHWADLHTFLWVRRTEPTLQMAVIHPAWLDEYLAEHPDAVRHERVRDGVLFTDDAAGLQAFALKWIKEPEGVADISELHRVAAGEPFPGD